MAAFALTYVLWGPVVIISALVLGAARAARQPIYAPVYILLSATVAALLATPVQNAFFPALPWWSDAINEPTKIGFLFKKVFICAAIFSAVGFLFFLIGLLVRAGTHEKDT